MDQKQIGKFIKDLRVKNNLTQKDLANKFGVTYQAVSKWENGKNIPDIGTVKLICKEFNVDINEVLDGKKLNKNNSKYFILLGAIIILILIYFLFFHKDDFEFKTLSTTCKEFEITGSAAFNNDKTSIYISNINYCGGNDNNKYKDIECSLYETIDNISILIASEHKNNISLEKYLEDIEFKIDNYTASCKNFKDAKLHLEIKATDAYNKITSYNVPIELKDSCLK